MNDDESINFNKIVNLMFIYLNSNLINIKKIRAQKQLHFVQNSIF